MSKKVKNTLELPQNQVQKFMSPWGWIVITLRIPWLPILRHLANIFLSVGVLKFSLLSKVPFSLGNISMLN